MILSPKEKMYLILQRQGTLLGVDLPYFVKNGFWVMIRQIIAAIAGLVILVILTRYISQAVFGQYQFVLSTLSVCMIFALPGMGTSLVQAIAQKQDGFYRQAFRLSLRASLIGSLVLAIIGICFLYSNTQVSSGFFAVAFLFPFLSVFILWESFLQGRERFDLVAKNVIVLSVLQVIVISMAVFFFPQNVAMLVLAYGLSAAFLNVYFYRLSLSLIRNDISDDQSVQFGYFMTRMNVWGILSEQIDKILIGIILGPVQLAVYAVISFFGVRIKDVVKSFTSMLVPKMTSGKYLFREILVLHKKTFLFFLLGITFLSFVFYISVGYMNTLMFSQAYESYGYLSKWYVLTIFLSIPLTFMGYYISAKKHTYAITLSNTWFHVARICINIVLISLYGLAGAVIAYNFSMVLLLFIYAWGISQEERFISSPL